MKKKMKSLLINMTIYCRHFFWHDPIILGSIFSYPSFSSPVPLWSPSLIFLHLF